ncbi:DUF3489 domain-containing protein [Mesorhizobium sp. M6A.T.Cr.TU.016.01.1.1]|uniref:DUF3489 domain-containing protein n=1 Tax=Mesorhizobium sp. M6A.T.Cr.TU.016.01.1.1 TaxID=2493677 RepID=UPI000F760347|nr:DUF3489 domain-containing protein [Mesorhizobium sp. M6A.T.Cr.TU.016.01.1.1]AZO67683.1 DUF3489 domain-containing protein [Mesorhizobium sp. M6A.T.Cr.TU.016.01.1.1]
MKSYNVKSNAKRFARQLAAKYPGYIADEPMPVIPGAMEWFPHVAAPTKVLAAGIPEEISGTAYVNGKQATPVIVAEAVIAGGDTASHDIDLAAEVANASKAREARKAPALRPYQQELVDAMTEPAPAAMKIGKSTMIVHKAELVAMTPAAMKAAVADLPPTKSTPEEIAARRAARASRAAEPKLAKVAKKSTKADTILELVSLADGATIRDIMAATDWQAHTVRGYIAGTLRKRGHNIVSKKIKGEETRYVIPRAEVEA